MDKVREYLLENGESKASDLAECLGLSPSRTRAILSDMDDVEAIGGTGNRTYRYRKVTKQIAEGKEKSL